MAGDPCPPGIGRIGVPQHLEVEHRDHAPKRDRGRLDELAGASHAVLLAAEGDEHDVSERFGRGVPEGVGDAGGDSVLYGTDDDARRFDWDQASEGNTHLVEWDAETGAGSIMATNYNDGERACWNAEFDDVPCE